MRSTASTYPNTTPFKILCELLAKTLVSKPGTKHKYVMLHISNSLTYTTSERKWKTKLKEWRFDKKISTTDMSIVVAKAGKRAREEGKDTIFFHGGVQITSERIGQFKRRKTTQEREPMSPGAGKRLSSLKPKVYYTLIQKERDTCEHYIPYTSR